MQTCETCRHWNTEPGIKPGFGVCEAVPEGQDLEPIGRAYVSNGDQYAAKLFTRSDFGCIAHEPRENQTP